MWPGWSLQNCDDSGDSGRTSWLSTTPPTVERCKEHPLRSRAGSEKELLDRRATQGAAAPVRTAKRTCETWETHRLAEASHEHPVKGGYGPSGHRKRRRQEGK